MKRLSKILCRKHISSTDGEGRSKIQKTVGESMELPWEEEGDEVFELCENPSQTTTAEEQNESNPCEIIDTDGTFREPMRSEETIEDTMVRVEEEKNHGIGEELTE